MWSLTQMLVQTCPRSDLCSLCSGWEVILYQGTHCTGKTGKWPKKIPCQGKRRKFIWPKQREIRSPLEKMLFLVQRPGEDITAEWDLFFLLFFGLKNFNIFSPNNNNKKRYCGRPTGHNFGHPLDRKQTFFKGGLMYAQDVNSQLSISRILWYLLQSFRILSWELNASAKSL